MYLRSKICLGTTNILLVKYDRIQVQVRPQRNFRIRETKKTSIINIYHDRRRFLNSNTKMLNRGKKFNRLFHNNIFTRKLSSAINVKKHKNNDINIVINTSLRRTRSHRKTHQWT